MDSLLKGMNDVLASYQTSIEVEMAKTIKYCAQDAVRKLSRESTLRIGPLSRDVTCITTSIRSTTKSAPGLPTYLKMATMSS